MIETLEERKANLLEYLTEEYKPKKPQRWWQSETLVYKTTREFGSPPGTALRETNEIIIRNDLVGAAIFAAFSFIIYIVMIFVWIENGINWFSLIIITLFLCISLFTLFDRRPKIIINSNGIWVHSWPLTITWKNVVATYVEEDRSSDSNSYKLIVHFYDEYKDNFYQLPASLEGLDIGKEAIAGLVEYWKTKPE
jgi:hypothetical protein